MTAGRTVLLRRLRRRRSGGGGAGGPHRGARRVWLGLAAIAGLVLVLGSLVLGGGAVYALSRYHSIADAVVPPEQLLASQSRGGARIYDRKGTLLYEFVDELAGLRRPVALQEISPWVAQATIAVEDPDFYDNLGVNIRGLVRAGVENFTPFLGGDLFGGSGGSSITQQLAKNVYIPRAERAQRSVERKLKETVIALELTQRYRKDQIFEWYLNSISYGGIYVGIEAASEGYFGKPASQLTLPEAALLVGIPQSPAEYDPYNPENIDPATGHLAPGSRAKVRQSEVLELMVRRGVISAEQADAARATTLQFETNRFDIEAPHFVLGRVADEVRKRFGDRALFDQGLEITTTLDLDLQHLAQQTMDKNLTDFGDAAGAHNGAFVAIDPRTGQLLVYVGSRDYFNDDIEGRNDNAAARNSPGSTLKPFAYMTAFMHGWGTGTAILDTPLSITDASTGQSFTPRNPGTGFQGPITAEKALGNSLNVTAIKTIIYGGVQNTIDTLKKVGYTTFDSPGGYGPALITGGSEITLLDHAIAYSVLANNGVMRGQDLVVTAHPDPQGRTLEPVALLKVADPDGKVLYEYKQPQERRVVPAEYAYLVTSILSNGQNQCITYGVCNALTLPNGYPSGAKTGTSEPFEDSRKIGETWTMGYTPELVSGIWAGNSDNAPIDGIDSTTVSLRTWKEFMVEALKRLKLPPTPFTRPGGLVAREVCWPSGRLPSALCPNINRYTSLYVAEQISNDPKQLANLTDTWWQQVRIDTRTGLIADSTTPAALVKEEVRLVFPPDEVRGWDALTEWAARNGVNSLVAPQAGAQPGSLPVLLTVPVPNQKVAGQVPVIGRAASPDFQRYIMEWGRGQQPTTWVRITASAAPVAGGLLGTWDTRVLANGAYTLRVRLDDAKLGTRQYAVPVTVDNGAQAPAADTAPVLLLTAPADGSLLRGRITISGVAASGHFTQVRAEVGKGLSPTDWFPIEARNTPVINGVIASWDTTGVEDGPYTLRVVLSDSVFGEAITQLLVVVKNKTLLGDPTPTPTPTPTPAR